ncbi:ParB/RepB/Spo0J family partition protein [Puniceicoccaceae bacterium K14]|nr:ParB/RepB/Spo0J family partition protein [Puniceicoccaceae bacterium K14]
MITTKRFDYISINHIQKHPTVVNHRNLNEAKVKHYAKDILANGLLEPLVVWEKSHGEYYLIGGFHRLTAIHRIRQDHGDYFDNVDVRVVSGTADEMRALNLKLNADRVDTKVTDYFDTVIYLNNVNWSNQRIADFLDKSTSWVEDILRYVPVMPPKIYQLLDKGETSWNRAKAACQKLIKSPAGKEDQAAADAIEELSKPAAPKPKKPLNFRSAKSRLGKTIIKNPNDNYTFSGEDLMSLLLVLEGKAYKSDDLERVKSKLPDLLG